MRRISNNVCVHLLRGELDVRNWQGLRKEIQEVYLADDRPWVIGYSGGKDSTTVLQLVWESVSGLSPEERQKTVFVISSDTLVETPVIVDFINETHRRLNESAAQKNMPFQTEKLRPKLTQTFWVNLVGRGYPAPWQGFRWCTDRLKIETSNRFIQEQVSMHGEVVLALGSRRSESSTRAQVMSLYEISGSPLSRHSKFAGAYVYTPIKDWSLDDVWDYLLSNESPWGNNNRDLVKLYRNATGECPLVVDNTTPSCGNSRFGCWVCTVVEREKSLHALISSGEEWMQPLLELRELLASTQEPAVKHLYRQFKRRQGNVSFKSDGSGRISRGPYYLRFCKEILRRLLKAQDKVRSTGPYPNIHLILPQELHEIRRIWRMERGDWADSVPKIYREITGDDLDWVRDDFGTFTTRENSLLDQICIGHRVPLRLVTKLLDAEIQTQGMSKRSSIYSKIDQVLREEWRTEEEVLRDAREHLPTYAKDQEAEAA